MITSQRLYYGLIGLITLMVIGSIAGVIVGDNRLRKQSDELSRLKTESILLDTQQSVLVQAKKDVEKYQDLTNIVKTIVPQEKDQAKTVRELVKIASESGVEIVSIAFPSSTLGQTATPSTSTGNAAPAPAPAANSSATTQVKPVTGISGVYQMDITTQTGGKPVTYNNLLGFLRKLENNRRTALVSSLSIQPNPDNRDYVTFNLSLSVFLKP